jgi:hypothetical protein
MAGAPNLLGKTVALGTAECGRTLRLAVEHREIEAEHPLADGPWVFNQSALETDAAARFVERVRRNNRDPAIPTSLQNDLEFPTT